MNDLGRKAAMSLDEENRRLYNKYADFMDLVYNYMESIIALKNLKEEASFSCAHRKEFEINFNEYSLTYRDALERDIVIVKNSKILERVKGIIPKKIMKKIETRIFFIDLHYWHDTMTELRFLNKRQEEIHIPRVFRILNDADENEVDTVIFEFIKLISQRLLEIQIEFEEVIKQKNAKKGSLTKIPISSEIQFQMAALKEMRELNEQK